MDAFDEFKKEAGSEINRILVENKEILSAKKKAYADLARQVNLTKMEIDKCRVQLEDMQREREQQCRSLPSSLISSPVSLLYIYIYIYICLFISLENHFYISN